MGRHEMIPYSTARSWSGLHGGRRVKMAFYRYIELAEHVLRTIPKKESQAVLIATLKDRKDLYLLQRGNYPGDVWWNTPDGESVFNRFRVENTSTHARVYDKNDKEDMRGMGSDSATAHTLATPFTGAERFIVAGSEASATPAGSTYIRAYEWTQMDSEDAFPDNEDSENMLKSVPVTSHDIELVREAIALDNCAIRFTEDLREAGATD